MVVTAPIRAALARIAQRSGRSVADLTELFQERAGMREYEAGETREVAENLAMADVMEMCKEER